MEHCKEQNNICKYSTIFSRSTAAPPVALQYKVIIVLKGWVSNRHHFTELCDNSLSPSQKCSQASSLLLPQPVVEGMASGLACRVDCPDCIAEPLGSRKQKKDSRPYNHTASKHSTTITSIISVLFTFRKRKKGGDSLSIRTKCEQEQPRFIFDLLQFLSNMRIRGHTLYTSHQVYQICRTSLKIL